MRNMITFLCLMALSAAAQSIPKDGKIYASGWGTKSSGTINTILTKLGANNGTIVLDAGEWSITNNVTFPANVRLEVPYGSQIDISSGIVFTVNGPFDADVHNVFDGLGTAAGSALFPYRYTQWGDTNQYNIGTGQISLANSSIETILNTDPNAGGESLTNLNTVQAITGNFDVVNAGTVTASVINGDITFSGSGTFLSNDMAQSYMGYPKVALTTNMMTFYEVGTSTEIPLTSFTNAFDASTVTITSQGDMAASDRHTYLIDLGANYNGFSLLKMSCTSTTDSAVMYVVNSSMTLVQDAAGYLMPRMNQFQKGLDNASTNIIRFWDIQPINGRYIYWSTATGGDDDLQYWIHDWSIYGTTNAYRNIGGF